MLVHSSRKLRSNTAASNKGEGLQDVSAREPLSTTYCVSS